MTDRPLEEIARDVVDAQATLENLLEELRSAQRDVRGRVDELAATGIREELATIHALGGRATSRAVAEALCGHESGPERGEVVSVGRRLFGLSGRGYLRRSGDEWLLTDLALAEMGETA